MLHPLLLCAMLPVAVAPWRSYEVYQPKIERAVVVDTHRQELKYNHDSSIAWFGDRWFCLWNANQPPEEGLPGQLNYVSTSRDGRTWSAPEAVFAGERCSVNPVPCPKGTQWQPNLLVVNGELWAVWCQNSRDDYNGTYLSRLKEPNGRWENQRLLWEGSPSPKVDGKSWRLFPTQNMIRLRSGRVLAPVTMIGPAAADAPAAAKGWWASEKRDSVLYTDDGGKTWHLSPGAVQPSRTWAQWEPTVWELSDGTVMMFARNNDFRGPAQEGPPASQMLLCSKSSDGGATWTPHEYVPLETVASRMHVLPAGGNRFMMIHNDWPAGRFVSDRLNLALFFTRGAGMDFVAGPGVSGHDPVVCYPQMWVRDNAVAICYSQGMHFRSIKVAHVSPLPDPARYYLFPRSNHAAPPTPERVRDSYSFAGGQHIATRQAVDPGARAFSIGAWILPLEYGALLDTRRSSGGGFVLGISGGRAGYTPFIHLGTQEGNLSATTPLPRGEWAYVGVTVDNTAGEVTFHINGKSETVKFTAPADLRGGTGHLGDKRNRTSQLSGFTGEIRSLVLYPEARFGVAEHNALYNRLAVRLNKPEREPATAPTGKPALSFDPVDAAAFARDFSLPQVTPAGPTVVTLDGRQALRVPAEASAGVDLDENRRDRGDVVRFRFRFRVEHGDSVLATVGDADQPARLIARNGQVLLRAGNTEHPCGKLNPSGWTAVEIMTARDMTTARVDGGAPVSVTHHPKATWLYLGQGYREGKPAGQFLVDVASVGSLVEQAKLSEPGKP